MRLVSRPRLALPGTALAASVLLSVTLGAGTAAAATNYVSNCSVNLRASASTSGTIVDVIATGALVTATGTVAGSSWSAACGGPTTSGSSWYVITAVNGKSTSSLYGRSSVYAATGLFSLAPPPPPPSSYAEGIDVSHWQGTINWAGVAAAGKKFAIMKATESTTYADDTYAANHSNARANGIRAGAYHFAQPSTTAGNAVAQADWFVSHANLQAGDLNPALDLEVSNGLSTTNLQAWVKAWLDRVYADTGIRPMIYTSPSFWSTYMGGTSAFATAGYTVLWVAHWFVTSPSVPGSNWGGHGWTFWQYSDCGTVTGIGGCVDLDRYNGTDFTKVTYGANFNVAATPTTASIKQGGSTSIAVAISRTWFSLPVTLSVSGVPAGASATLDTTATSGSSATVTFKTSNSGTITPFGTYTLTITGTANGLTRSTTATIAVTDGVPPTVTVPVSRLYALSYLGSTGAPGMTSWTGSDASGIGSFMLQQQVNGGTWTTVGPTPTTASSMAAAWAYNATYAFRVRATDITGNTGSFAYGPHFSLSMNQETSSAIHYGGTWYTGSTTYASGGTLKYTRSSGAWASETFSGAAIAWVSYRGPTRGMARVYVDGVLVSTVDLYAATNQNKAVVFAKNWSANGTHTIKIVCLATSGRPRIDLDGFVRLVLS